MRRNGLIVSYLVLSVYLIGGMFHRPRRQATWLHPSTIQHHLLSLNLTIYSLLLLPVLLLLHNTTKKKERKKNKMSPSLRRLMKEATELTTSPSPHFHASPVSDTNLYDWHFTLTGPPPPSPYSSGIYHGRITFPPTYPLRPPSFRFLTPTGRFEVNREICLSISGHHEESWQPAWGVRTALLAIRSFMDADAKGQVGGLDVSEEARREYARGSREWCCEVCAGAEGGRSRSNEEVMREWREGVCKEKGVVLAEDGEGEVVAPLPERRDERETQREQQGTAQPSSTVEAEPPEAELPAHQQEPQQQQPQSVPPANPPPSTTTTTIPRQYQPQAQPVAANSQSPDGLWLDRAIIGVLAALVIMIMRRVLNAELEDYL